MDQADREMVMELIELRVMKQMREQRRWIIGTIIAATLAFMAVVTHLESHDEESRELTNQYFRETLEEVKEAVDELRKPGSDDPQASGNSDS